MNGQQEKSEYQRKVAWLKRYQESQRTERRLIEELAQLRAEAASVSQALSGAPSGGGDGSDSEARPADETASWRWRSAPVFARA